MAPLEQGQPTALPPRPGQGRSKRIEQFLENRAFSRSYDLAPRPSPFPPPHPSESSTGDTHTQEDWGLGEKGGGVGEEPNHITQEILVLYKSFNTL